MEVAGIKFWCYTAGHVLGAAMFMIEIAGVKVGEIALLLKKSKLPKPNDKTRILCSFLGF